MANPTNRNSLNPELTIIYGDIVKGRRKALVLAVDASTRLDALITLLVEQWKLPTANKKGLVGYDLYVAGQHGPLKPSTRLADLGDQGSPLRLDPVEGSIVLTEGVPEDLATFDVFHPDSKQKITIIVSSSTKLTVGQLRDRLERLWDLPSLWDEEIVYYEVWAQNRKLPLDDPLAEQGIPKDSVLALIRQEGIEIQDALDPRPSGGIQPPDPPPPPPFFVDWRYLDFDLQTVGGDTSYQVEVVQSPAGNAREPFEPPDPLRVENFVLRAGRARQGVRGVATPQWDAAKEFGQDLFGRVFRGRVLACLVTSLRVAHDQNCGLRLKLRLDKTPELMSLPWEFMYDPGRRMFLASREALPIVRFINSNEPLPPMAAEKPLRILAMAANPPNVLALNIAEERDKLQEALQPLLDSRVVVIDWVKGGSLTALQTHLQYAPQRYHVFHFIGHGGFDARSGEGYLFMEKKGATAQLVTGELLGSILQTGNRRFRLVVLNTCEGARTGTQDPFAGTATSLLLTCDLAAVVAMQFEITDEAAITFTSSFYGGLVTGRPVDTAVTTARLAILAAHENIEWGTPVLYMRSPDGKLFDFASRVPGS